MKTRIAISAALLFFLISCNIKPQKIAYGEDICHYCKMNIVDDRHASEIITKKGEEITRYKSNTDSKGDGKKGKRVGIAYELENGEIIYVPE